VEGRKPEMDTGFGERLAGVRRRVEDACARSGRVPDEVTLVAVAKKFGPDHVREAADNGIGVIGENRVQEAREKIPLCPGDLQWHMIGHLQRNKVRPAVGLFHMIESVDSTRLLESIDAACGDEGKTLPLCLEVNVSGERSKFGCPPDEVPEMLGKASGLMNVDVVGLMTMPPFTKEAEDSRQFFRRLRELRDEWQERTGVELRELSMGMSQDFGVAVEEGATLIRLGTALFGSRSG